MASSEGKRIEKRGSRRESEQASALPGKRVAERGGMVKEEIDELLDEIDQVLEENAEEFVKNYVQRGGE